ncbi:MAG: ATP-binding protein [Nitriliruptor sp.]|uniref:ATP-binding protein n=1 Tax=Nitriliruptor sp. TaxID=2448056 RepID=UPI0034A03474
MSDATPGPELVGRVLGTEDATPLEFWVGVAEGQFLQLDDVVALQRTPPGRQPVNIYGVVSQVRARHEGARFDSDVFLIEDGVLPAEVSEAAQVLTTRFEPEVFVPPLPGQAVVKATGDDRDQALFFDRMERRLPAGLTRDDLPVVIDLDFLDGTRGAHVNISGVSGVATKTTYATFLLHGLFTSGVLGAAHNAKALVFNVKGEDLLFLDHDNVKLDDTSRAKYEQLGLPASAFASVEMWAPPRRGAASAAPDTGARREGIGSFFWTLEEFCRDALLPFLFADAGDDRQQYTMVVDNVTARLQRDAVPTGDGAVRLEGVTCRTFRELIDVVRERLESEDEAPRWAGRAVGVGTINAFVRRLYGSLRHVEDLIRGDVPHPERHTIRHEAQVTVVDIHRLNDRAKRFVVGVVLRRQFDAKEASGSPDPLTFIVLDELNKYAPREGSSPIKELLLDVAERGRSLGMILIGAQQTASEVERRVVANCAIRVVGRLDTAEAGRDEYGFLPTAFRQRATIVKPGTMILSQPQLPVPLVVEFPFPSWATRPSEAGRGPTPGADDIVTQPDDPFAGLDDGADGGDGMPF